MSARLVAVDEGPDIPLDRAMIVVGRHPQCDARLDSLRVSRHHCCMTQEHGEVLVRDLGSTNGIRINGQRVEFGRLRPGDELSIAHIRYRLENGHGHEATIAANDLSRAQSRERPWEPDAARHRDLAPSPLLVEKGSSANGGHDPPIVPFLDENALTAALRNALPAELARYYRVQVVHQDEPSPLPPPKEGGGAEEPAGLVPAGPEEPAEPAPMAPGKAEACQPDSSP